MAHEIATNSVLHGDGASRVRLWAEHRNIICEFTDGGHMRQPQLGASSPERTKLMVGGLWMVNQLCDLVQISSIPGQTVVRLHKAIVAARNPGTNGAAV